VHVDSVDFIDSIPKGAVAAMAAVMVAVVAGGPANRQLRLAQFVSGRPPGRRQILSRRPPAGGRRATSLGPIHILSGPVDRGPDVAAQ
jgi:hypothetical protein